MRGYYLFGKKERTRKTGLKRIGKDRAGKERK
jgi:hypothetical protein